MIKLIQIILLLGVLQIPLYLKAQHVLESNYYSDNYSSPGVSFNYAYTLKSFAKEKNGKHVNKQYLVGWRFAFYNRVKNHQAYIFSPFIRFQKTFPSGIFFQPELGLGFLYKKNAIPTYSYENDEFSEIKKAGHSRVFPSLSFGMGYSLAEIMNTPVQIHFRPGISLETPNNTSSLIHFQAEIGVSYSFGKK